MPCSNNNIQLICLLFNWVEYLKRPEKFCFKFSVFFHLDLFTIEPDLLPWYLALKLLSLTIGLLLEIIGMQKVLAINIYQLTQFYS